MGGAFEGVLLEAAGGCIHSFSFLCGFCYLIQFLLFHTHGSVDTRWKEDRSAK
jgi:hypothetical protein